MLNSGAELLKHSGLFYGEFSERVTIGSKGKVLVPTPAQVERKSSMRVLADEAGAAAKTTQPDVTEVNAHEEAEKDATS